MKLQCRAPRLAALVVVAASALPALMTSAHAQEKTDYKDIYNNILGNIGLGKERDPIDYSPRAPIVVPPTNNLPPPVDSVQRGAGFPDDPDVFARRKALVDPRQPVPPTDSGVASKTRAYLIEPPAAYFDASAVAATGQQADKGEAPAAPKHQRKHRSPAADSQ